MLLAWVIAQAAGDVHVNVDPVLVLLRQLSVGSAVAAVLLVLFLIFFQRKLTEGLLKLLAFVGLLVLPMVSLGLGNVVGLEQAKMAGLNDVYKYYTRTYKIPVRMHAPYPNAECLKCHENTPKFVNSEAHAELLPAIRAGEFSCIDCHGPAHVVEWNESRHAR